MAPVEVIERGRHLLQCLGRSWPRIRHQTSSTHVRDAVRGFVIRRILQTFRWDTLSASQEVVKSKMATPLFWLFAEAHNVKVGRFGPRTSDRWDRPIRTRLIEATPDLECTWLSRDHHNAKPGHGADAPRRRSNGLQACSCSSPRIFVSRRSNSTGLVSNSSQPAANAFSRAPASARRQRDDRDAGGGGVALELARGLPAVDHRQLARISPTGCACTGGGAHAPFAGARSWPAAQSNG